MVRKIFSTKYQKYVEKSSKIHQQLIKLKLLRQRGCFIQILCEKCVLNHGLKSKKVTGTYDNMYINGVYIFVMLVALTIALWVMGTCAEGAVAA